ncbi:MAG: hypothetical protein ABL883_08970 [Terricaulis sp.]
MIGVLDRTHFAHMTGGDRALQLEIIALFRSQASGWDIEFSNPSTEWRAAAHMAKGSARGIGLATLALACETAESASNFANAAALAHLRAELGEALAALEKFAAEER